MDKVKCHKNNFQEKLKEVNDWNISPNTSKNIKAFFKDYEIGKVTGRRGSDPEANLLRNLYYLKIAVENIDKETPKEVERFLTDLLKDKVQYKIYNKTKESYSSRPYAMRTKKAIIKILYTFYKWRKKDNLANCLDFDLSTKKHDFQVLTEDEVTKIIEATETLDKKFLIYVLNSTGMRAEEFHNIRHEDVTIPTKDNNKEFVSMVIKNQYSKTKGRTVSLYDPEATSIVKKYITFRLGEGMLPKDPIYPLGYNGTREYLKRLGKKAINKNIHYHLFRHTAATRLASKMNRQQLCVYFGWKFSSPMPDIYIERAGVNMDDVESRFQATAMEELQTQLKDQNKKIDQLTEQINNINLTALDEFFKAAEKNMPEDIDPNTPIKESPLWAILEPILKIGLATEK